MAWWSQCPYCEFIAYSTDAEVEHMQECHPEIIEQRMTDAGFRKDESGEWIDTLAADDR